MRQYKEVKTLSADVTRTRHNAALTSDETTHGRLYFKAPGRMSINFDEVGDELLMDNGVFTMVNGWRKSVAKGPTLSQFEALVAVFKEMVLGIASKTPLQELANVQTVTENNRCTLTVTPLMGNGNKTGRRLLFSSFVLTIDMKAAEFTSFRMNERGKNYTQYDFSGFDINGEVPDEAFNL